METMMKYFKGSAAITVIGIILGYLIAGPQGAFICAILAVLEVSLSFDNAVVNATVLKDMDEKWRKRFITWGMLIAVFGMRIVFPLLIVTITASIGPIDAVMMAINQPEEYEAAVTAAHYAIAGFGGAFLFMVFLEFFIDDEKDVHWLGALEAPIATLAKFDAIHILITVATAYGFAYFLQAADGKTFFYSAILGVATHTLVTWLGIWLDGDSKDHVDLATPVAKSGFASFMYLELLDASFSFDGVIGAFALSNNIFIIAIGLGIGAMFVRSLTIMFVDKGTLDQFKYLEHGAFIAIGILATIMFAGTLVEIPEVVTGLLGASVIGLSLLSSIRYNKRVQSLAH